MASRDPIGVDERDLDDVVLEALAEAHAVQPPPRLRARILDEARQHPPLRVVPPGGTRWRMIGSLAASLAIVLAGLLARERARGSRREDELASLRAVNAELTTQLRQQGQTLVALREALDTQVHVLQVLSGPHTITAQLAPKGDTHASGRVLVDAGNGDVALVVTELAALEAGKAYELWAIRGDRPPEPAGVFVAAASGATAVRLPRVVDPRTVSAFAVSIEPASGSSAPTGPIVLVGAVAS